MVHECRWGSLPYRYLRDRRFQGNNQRSLRWRHDLRIQLIYFI
jgi:hypothetical protein